MQFFQLYDSLFSLPPKKKTKSATSLTNNELDHPNSNTNETVGVQYYFFYYS
jgi:hypothetical protein